MKILPGNIPEELHSFLSVRGGHSLIIRGNAGTGKTTLALQLMEELVDMDSSFYFSTRISDSVILNQFPWLAGQLYTNEPGEPLTMRTEPEESEVLTVPPDMAES